MEVMWIGNRRDVGYPQMGDPFTKSTSVAQRIVEEGADAAQPSVHNRRRHALALRFLSWEVADDFSHPCLTRQDTARAYRAL